MRRSPRRARRTARPRSGEAASWSWNCAARSARRTRSESRSSSAGCLSSCACSPPPLGVQLPVEASGLVHAARLGGESREVLGLSLDLFKPRFHYAGVEPAPPLPHDGDRTVDRIEQAFGRQDSLAACAEDARLKLDPREAQSVGADLRAAIPAPAAGVAARPVHGVEPAVTYAALEEAREHVTRRPRVSGAAVGGHETTMGSPFIPAPLPLHRCAHGFPDRGVDDRQLGGLLANPVALRPLKTAALPALVVLDPLAAVPHLLALVERVREDHAHGGRRPSLGSR